MAALRLPINRPVGFEFDILSRLNIAIDFTFNDNLTGIDITDDLPFICNPDNAAAINVSFYDSCNENLVPAGNSTRESCVARDNGPG